MLLDLVCFWFYEVLDSKFSCVLLSSFYWSLAPNLHSNLGILFDPSLLGSFTRFLGTFLFLAIVYAVYFCPVLNNAELYSLFCISFLSSLPEPKTCLCCFISLLLIFYGTVLNILYDSFVPFGSEGALLVGNDDLRF